MGLKFGIIGCGGISARFAEALKLVDSSECYAVAARDLTRADQFVKKHGGVKAYGDYLSLIQDEEVDAVYIGLVHTEHYHVARMCVENGKPVLCEKPFFIDSAEGKELKQYAKEKDVLIMEAMWTRCLPAFQMAKKWLQDGRIGIPKIIQANFCFQYPYTEQTKNFRLWDPKVGGGALLDAGVYPYEYMTGMMDSSPVEYDGVLQYGITNVDTTSAFCMRFSNGVLGVGMASLVAQLSQDAYISGTEGYIKQFDFLRTRKCELYNNEGELVDSFAENQQEGFVYEILHFETLIRENKKESPLITVDDSIDFSAHAKELLAKYE